MKTLEIKYRVPVTVETTEVNLPYHFSTGSSGMVDYYCMTEELCLIKVWSTDNAIFSSSVKYYSIEDATAAIEREMGRDSFKTTDADTFEAVFLDAQRKLYYTLNPELRPIV